MISAFSFFWSDDIRYFWGVLTNIHNINKYFRERNLRIVSVVMLWMKENFKTMQVTILVLLKIQKMTLYNFFGTNLIRETVESKISNKLSTRKICYIFKKKSLSLSFLLTLIIFSSLFWLSFYSIFTHSIVRCRVQWEKFLQSLFERRWIYN